MASSITTLAESSISYQVHSLPAEVDFESSFLLRVQSLLQLRVVLPAEVDSQKVYQHVQAPRQGHAEELQEL